MERARRDNRQKNAAREVSRMGAVMAHALYSHGRAAESGHWASRWTALRRRAK